MNDNYMDVITDDSVDDQTTPDTKEQEPGETENVQPDVFDTLDRAIDNLPTNFPQAALTIRDDIAPLLLDCEPSIVEHYTHLIKKKTQAANKKCIQDVIKEALVIRDNDGQEDFQLTDDFKTKEPDPEVIERVEEIRSDPQAFRKRIEFVNSLGLVRERQAIGMYFLTLDSRLLPMRPGVSEVMALKNSGPYGSGKSCTLNTCLTIYPKNKFHLIDQGSPKSFYYLGRSMEHMALILAEGFSLQQNTTADTEFSYIVRSLVSEGKVTYQYSTGTTGTQVVTIKGPVSLITTTVYSKLESQLEDRMWTIHPDSSPEQTKRILEMESRKASGELVMEDEIGIEAWIHFHGTLEPVQVHVPFMREIIEFLIGHELPLSARRTVKSLVSAIKTVALFHQHQREKDEQGRVIAEIRDYAIAYQLVRDAFMERMGMNRLTTDRRIELIEREGPISYKSFCAIEQVKNLSDWVRDKVQEGLLTWCDKEGNVYPDETTLMRAKKRGDAHLRTTRPFGLPTPFELTGEPAWDAGGELYEMYDLGLVGSRISESREKESVYELTEQEPEVVIEISENGEDESHNQETEKPGVSVLCEDDKENSNIVRNDIEFFDANQFAAALDNALGVAEADYHKEYSGTNTIN